MNGTLGHQAHRMQQFSYTWNPGDTLVMCSDGLATQWRLEPYPGLLARHPSLVAGVLYRDFARGRDDATVLVAREVSGRSAP
jgi:serine/threonine protein phosphatase PrpC